MASVNEIITILHEASVHINDESGTVTRLKLVGQDDSAYCFSDSGKTADVRLSIDEFHKNPVLKVDAVLHLSHPLFKHQNSFNMKDAVVIRIPVENRRGNLLSIYQHKNWWIRPQFSDSLDKIFEKTQMILWKEKRYNQITAVCGSDYRCDINGYAEGIEIRLSSNSGGLNRCVTPAVVLSEGDNPYECCKESIQAGIAASGSPAMPREEKKLPVMFRYMGWCSWDSLGQDVNEVGIIEKLEELREKKTPVRWIIIDDGWSDISGERLALKRFEADRGKFPDGLGSFIKKVKKDDGIKWVGVWHTIMAYWNGIEPDSEVNIQCPENLMTLPNQTLLPDTRPERAFGLWDKWHSFLKKQGVDFLKVDSQSSITNYMSGIRTYGGAARDAHRALEASVGLNFDGAMINCMGMAPENIWNRGNTAVSRNSDDFVPRTRHGFREHILQNAYNALLHGQFYFCDWDMFWTHHGENKQNAVGRAISGGPVYISDGAGLTDMDYIKPLVFNDGEVLMCDRQAVPCPDSLFCDPLSSHKPFKLFNTVGDYGIIAAYNICEERIIAKGGISADDIPQLKGSEYLVYDWYKNKAAALSRGEIYPVEIEQNDTDLYLLCPLISTCTPIGLIDKWISPRAITKVWRDECKTAVYLKEGGIFAFGCDKKPSKVLVNGNQTGISVKDGYYQITCEGQQLLVEILHF